MKRMLISLALVCVAMAAAPLSGGDKDSSKHGLNTVDMAWKKAMLANDAAAAAALYDEDAILVLPGSPEIKGRKAIADAYAGWLGQQKVTAVTIDNAQYRTSGNISSGWGTWTMTTEPRAGGASTTATGTWMAIAEKKNGKWMYVADHASEDPPPAPTH